MDSSQGVYMDTDAVRAIAKKFQELGELLENVSSKLEMLMNRLKMTAFMGLVGGYAVIAFIQTIKPQIDRMAQKCEELHGDLNQSVDAYERGDAEGATRFH